MTNTFKRIAPIIIMLIVLFSLLYCLGLIKDIEQACVNQQTVGIKSLSANELSVEVLDLKATGAATAYGLAEGYVTTTNALSGDLVAIYIDYTAAISSTTDITLSYMSPLSGIVFAKITSATDAIWYPRAGPVSNAAAAITNGYVPCLLAGHLVAQSDQTVSGTVGTMYIFYRRP